MKKITDFIGVDGVTSDQEFGDLADLLDEVGVVVREHEPESFVRGLGWFDMIATTYRVDQKYYELWYQLRTPYAPKDVECGYGFNEVAPVE